MTLTGKSTNVYSSSYTTTLNGKSPLPKYFGSINLSAGYKGLTLSAQLYFSGGNYIYNAQYESPDGRWREHIRATEPSPR